MASEGTEHKTVMIDATYLKAHRTASSLRAKKGGPTTARALNERWVNTKLHAVTDARAGLKFLHDRRPDRDYTGAAALWAVCLRPSG